MHSSSLIQARFLDMAAQHEPTLSVFHCFDQTSGGGEREQHLAQQEARRLRRIQESVRQVSKGGLKFLCVSELGVFFMGTNESATNNQALAASNPKEETKITKYE